MNNFGILHIFLGIAIGTGLGISGAYCCCKLSDIWNRKKTPDRDHIQSVKDQKYKFEELLEDLQIHNRDDKR